MNEMDLEFPAFTKKLGVEEFSQLFGVPIDTISPQCSQLINQFNFSYEPLDPSSRDQVILQVLKTLDTDLPVSGKSRIERWEEGWAENLKAFIDSGYKLETLTPGYYKSYHKKIRQVMRLSGQYILPQDPDFETNFFRVLRLWLCETYLRDVTHVYEFGCGPAHNLAAFAEIHPHQKYYGLDWARPSQAIIKALAEAHNLPIDGHRFELFFPDENYQIQPDAAIVTIGAMEQLGTEFEPFLQYCLRQSPKIFVHIEPIDELYNCNQLFDYLAARYHAKRGYLSGYLTRLQQLEEAGTIKIIQLQKHIGNLYQDSWNSLVFKLC